MKTKKYVNEKIGNKKEEILKEVPTDARRISLL